MAAQPDFVDEGRRLRNKIMTPPKNTPELQGSAPRPEAEKTFQYDCFYCKKGFDEKASSKFQFKKFISKN